MSSPQLTIPPYAQSGGKRATFDRWQSMIGFAILLAVLGALFAAVYDREMRTPEPGPTMLAALSSDEGTPHPIESVEFNPRCIAQNTVESSETNERWDIPNYTPAIQWIDDHQWQMYQTFVTYVVCRDERGNADVPSDAERTYLSPRLLFLLGADESSASLEASPVSDPHQVMSDLFDPTQRIISDFPLPLNSYHSYGPSNIFSGEWGAYPPFDAYQIYSLPGNRWAAIGGSVTTHMLQTGEPIRTGDGELAYISFIPLGDRYVIDEYFLICPSDIVASLADEDESMVNQEPFDPAELIRNPDATCG